MSFNYIIDNSFQKFREILNDGLEKNGYDTATLNEITRLKSYALDLLLNNITNIDGLLNEIIKVNEFDLFKDPQIEGFQTSFNAIINRILLLKNFTENKFIDYQNKMSLQENVIISQKKKVLQKISFLNHVANNYQKVFIEEFQNLEFINGQETNLLIDTNANLATLPVLNSTPVKVTDIFITENSNGLSGALNSRTNGNLWFTVDKNENTIFEYNKLDSGPCILGLKYTFEETVINEIRIKTKITNLTSTFKIKNITFDSGINGSKTIKEVIDINKQNLLIDYFSYDKSIGYSIKFLPIKCSSLTIEFEQPDYQNNYIQQTTQVSYRKVFTIAISEIEFFSNKYINNGSLGSKIFELGYGLNGCDYKLSIYPNNNAYYKSNMQLFQGGNSTSIELKENEFNLLVDNLSNYQYKLNIEKVSDSENTKTPDSNFESLIETKSLIKFLDPINNTFVINDTFVKESVFICRPDIVKRSSTNEKTIIRNLNSSSGVLSTDENYYTYSLQMPSWIFQLEDVFFYKGSSNTPLSSQSINYDINTNTMSIKIPKQENFIGITPLRISCKPKKTFVNEKNDTCYIEIKENFEPDKAKIKIFNTNNDLNVEDISIGNLDGNTIYDLNQKNIVKILKAEGVETGISYNINEIILNSIEGKIKINSDLIQLATTNNDNNLKIQFSYLKGNPVENKDYEFWFKDNKIKGIAIKNSNLFINTVEESLKDNNNSNIKFKLSNKKNIVVNSVNFGNLIFNGQSFEIVEYKDGSVEFDTYKNAEDTIPDQEIDYEQPFIGFRINRDIDVKSNKLITSYEQSKNASNKQFDLIIKDSIYNGYITQTDEKMYQIISDLNLDLSNDETPYNRYSQAIYSLESNTGIFIAKRDDLILRNAKVNYSYFIAGENTNKISIDYASGWVYSSKPILNSEVILVSYKVCNIELEYSIYENVTSNFITDKEVQYDNSIIQDIAPLNKNIKLYYGKIKTNYDIKDTFEYYSPLIYSIKLGFN